MAKLDTKSYQVQHERGSFRIFISPLEGSLFIGSFVYYDKVGSWSQNEDVTITLKEERFKGLSHDDVLQECKEWINSNLGTEYTIIQQ